jgi:glucosamine 6-phosphate synthetase-like amidotransferase/phosphosugar isomerase protein
MNTVHPMLTHILSLRDPATWQTSIDLAEAALSSWFDADREVAFERVYLVGCGSSLYNGQVGKYAIEHLACLPAEAIPGFSFSAYAEAKLLGPKVLVVGISTTGATQAVFDSLALAKQSGSPTLGITAHQGSAITQVADAVILTGGEDDQISVKTKSYVQALIPLYLLALYLAEGRGSARSGLREVWITQLDRAAQGASQFLSRQRLEIETLARTFSQATQVLVLGTGPNRGTAEEASLKVIEMAKMVSAAQELENFLHGRLRMVDQINPLFLIAPSGHASQRVLDFLTVSDTIGATSIVLTDKVSPGIEQMATHIIQMPGGVDEYATPLLYILPLYLFGYELALLRGYDPTARRYDLVPQNVRYLGRN